MINNIDKTIENLLGLRITEDIENDIICAIETSDDVEIIVDVVNGLKAEMYQKDFSGRVSAYENKEDGLAFTICFEDGISTDVYQN